MSTGVTILGTGGSEGTSIGATTADKASFHGVTPVVQAAHIADPTDLATALTAIIAIIVALENKGILAKA